LVKQAKAQEQTFRIFVHRPTIEALEKVTKKRYSQNGEKLIQEVLKMVRKF